MRILLVDDHDLLRQGLSDVLAAALPDAQIRSVSSGLEAVADAQLSMPGLVVLDINMPHLDGVETAQRLLGLNPDLAIVFMTIRSDSSTLRRAFAAGGRGYVLKDEAVHELVRAVTEVAAGRSYISPKLAGVLDLGSVTADGPDLQGGVFALTERELEVLAHLAGGENSKEIATRLGLSSKTVDSHRRNIQSKLGVDSVAELTRIAIREGLISLAGIIPDRPMLRGDTADKPIPDSVSQGGRR